MRTGPTTQENKSKSVWTNNPILGTNGKLSKCRPVSITGEKNSIDNITSRILTDSQAAITALSSTIVSSKIVWECIGNLNKLDRNNKVSLLWVPGPEELREIKLKKGPGLLLQRNTKSLDWRTLRNFFEVTTRKRIKNL